MRPTFLTIAPDSIHLSPIRTLIEIMYFEFINFTLQNAPTLFQFGAF